MPLLSILYRLLRCLLGLTAVLDTTRPEQGRRTAGVAPRERCVAPPDPSGPLHARRPSVAGRLIPAAAAPPLDRGLRRHSCHDPGLAPQARLTEMGLHRPPPARTSPNRNTDRNLVIRMATENPTWGHRRV